MPNIIWSTPTSIDTFRQCSARTSPEEVLVEFATEHGLVHLAQVVDREAPASSTSPCAQSAAGTKRCHRRDRRATQPRDPPERAYVCLSPARALDVRAGDREGSAHVLAINSPGATIGVVQPMLGYASERDDDAILTLDAWAAPTRWGVEERPIGFLDRQLLDRQLIEEDVPVIHDLADWAHDRWSTGRRVLIRCQGGMNGSGLLVAWTLVRAGHPPEGTRLTGCGGPGEDSAPAGATAATTDMAVGTQQLLVNQ